MTFFVEVKLYKTEPKESPTKTRSQCLSIREAIFCEYAVKVTIFDLFFFFYKICYLFTNHITIYIELLF